MSVNDINNDNVATIESSVNIDDEINVVNYAKIHKSSEIHDDIRNATGNYNITNDYFIDWSWGIFNNNLIIEGNNHTIYGMPTIGTDTQAFIIWGKNVNIKNLNFVGCSASDKGGAIYFGENSSGSVIGCSFVGCSSSNSVLAGVSYGGAIFFGVVVLLVVVVLLTVQVQWVVLFT